ncbi:MAG: tRNA pseudouridine(55) synthase TruB [Nitrospiraceae bacterium]|nr:tRNA pseudouridine(55) synthase TruB [Nitrospiraceae bacterium]
MHIVVNLDKPSGMSSQEAVTAVKKIFKCRKAGHAGTLDPVATGILIICLNEATKITGYISGLDKEYIMTGRLGETTDTYDSEGKITSTRNYSSVSEADMRAALNLFLGETEQRPPIYSAIKKNGEPLYKLARRGETPEVQPRRVRMDEIELLSFDPPHFTIRVVCSKGTYMRSLCFDLGENLGCGSHMTQLRRTRTGMFNIKDSAMLDELPAKTEALMDINTALSHLKDVVLNSTDLKLAKNGNPVKLPESADLEQGSHVKLKVPDSSVFGMAKVVGDSLKIERLFNI